MATIHHPQHLHKTLQLVLAQLPKPGEAIDWSIWLEIFPALHALNGCPQDPFYHAEGCVWTHTKMVCEALIDLPDYANADQTGQFVLFIAALLHDIAKPSVTKYENGRVSSKGHSSRGEIDARIMLWRMAVPFEWREMICRIIRAHLSPFITMVKHENPKFMLHQLSHELNIQYLSAVAEADARGRRTIPESEWQVTLDNIALFRLLAQEEGCYSQPKSMADEHTRLHYFRSRGAISCEYAIHRDLGAKVILLSGLPASGKNTYVEKHYADLSVVSYDDAREQLNLKHGQNDGKAAHLVREQVREYLRNKTSFVWNATHLSMQMRERALDLLYAYHAEVEIVYLECREATIKQRNQARDTTLTNAGIEQMLFRWEVPRPTEAHRVRYVFEA